MDDCLSDKIHEIRLADRKIFNQFLEFETKVPISYFQVDCTNGEQLENAVKGSTVVFHLAAKRYPFSNLPQDEKLYQENNVQGGPLGVYGRTKFQGEERVRQCGEGRTMKNGEKLNTIIVRPGILYGEGDTGLVPYTVRLCQKFGCLPVAGCRTAGNLQLTYAGNAAAMLVKAWEQLERCPEKFGGEVFFCTENAGYTQYYDYVSPFVKAAGYKLAPFSIPYYIASAGGLILEQITKVTAKKICGEDFPSHKMIQIGAAWGQGFSSLKTRLFLDFKPPYDSKKAMEDTVNWWTNKLSVDRQKQETGRENLRG